MIVVPMHLREANEFVANFHRHNRPGRDWQPVQSQLRLRWEPPA